MCGQTTSLYEIKKWKEKMFKDAEDNTSLNNYHDHIFQEVFTYCFENYAQNYGSPPCEFSWFVTGSAGRREQGIFSDQDHGLIYELEDDTIHEYFLNFGERLSDALNEVGYPYCEGKVMSSNPLWCNSLNGWKKQLNAWLEKENWESIRYLQIFYDCRGVYGSLDYVKELRTVVHQFQKEHPSILKRFMNNVMRIKKGVGLFGQFFVERTGPYRGSIHLKNTMYLPYVNSIRLLALKEGIHETSTLKRMEVLNQQQEYKMFLDPYEHYFKKILKYRITLFHEARVYEDVHYLNIKKLTKEERQEIKLLMRKGIKLYQQVQRIIEKGC